MPKDAKIDAYIGTRATDFARPILNELRNRVHVACPATEEAIKWGMPSFTYQGKILATMAAFKGHVSFGFWHGELVTGDTGKRNEAMGSFGRIKSIDDLPKPAAFAAMVEKAMVLIETNVPTPSAQKVKEAKPDLPIHPAFKNALEKEPEARAHFDGMSPSQRREYLQWINDAKQDATRERRIAQAISWISEGKGRNWKYER